MTSTDEDRIAKWYRDKDDEARRLRELIRERTKEGASKKELDRLKKKLELAEYVGD